MSRPSITRAMREEVARRYGAEPGSVVRITCSYCPSVIDVDWTGRRVHFVDEMGRYYPELDHVDPLYWGGAHNADNLVPACLRCNRSKGPRRLA